MAWGFLNGSTGTVVVMGNGIFFPQERKYFCAQEGDKLTSVPRAAASASRFVLVVWGSGDRKGMPALNWRWLGGQGQNNDHDFVDALHHTPSLLSSICRQKHTRKRQGLSGAGVPSQGFSIP